MPKTKTIGRKLDQHVRVGVALLGQLSTTFYLNTRMIFDELISNARDAFATYVKIAIDADKITVEDNGEGLSPDEMVRFFYISHTQKKSGSEEQRGKLKRQIIGKFGVGKLSMYQICDWFEIRSWKDGIESYATFNFKEVEKGEFLDQVGLNVSTKKTSQRQSGTVVTMHDLKKQVKSGLIAYGLSKSMPLSADFNVFVNGQKLEPEKKAEGHIYPIEEKDVKVEVDGKTVELGDIYGELLYTKKPIRDQSGVYIRVLGRLVGDNPRRIDLTTLTSGQQFYQRTHCELNVNGLNEALLTNRTDFMQDHPKYVAFIDWLKTQLNKYNRLENKRFREELKKEERKGVVAVVAPRINLRMATVFKDKNEIKKAISSLPPAEKIVPEEAKGEHMVFDLLVERFVLEIDELGEGKDECIIGSWSRGARIIINANHPLFIEARKSKFLNYHCFKAAIVAIALAFATSLPHAKGLYAKMALDLTEKMLTGAEE